MTNGDPILAAIIVGTALGAMATLAVFGFLHGWNWLVSPYKRGGDFDFGQRHICRECGFGTKRPDKYLIDHSDDCETGFRDREKIAIAHSRREELQQFTTEMRALG